jgi:large subunit ribosomal protein L3
MIGLVGRKLGMTQLFTGEGNLEAVTVIEAGPCVITQIKTRANDGYNAVQLGFSEAKRLNLPQKGHLKKSKQLVKYLREFRVSDPAPFQLGQKVDSDFFKPGDLVDVIGISKGKGFAGVIKRHHFSGGPKSHGQSDRHRAPGSVGGTTFPGRVLKGLRMAGHMGNQQVTVKNLKVLRVDTERHLLFIGGAVPGAKNGLLILRKSLKQG